MKMMSRGGIILVVLLIGATSAVASEAGGHADPGAPVLLALIILLAVAKLGSEIFERLGQPAVLGELLGGILLGNLILVNSGWDFFEPLRAANIQENWAVVIDILARLGVIILLFEVGLESTVRGMMKVGASSLFVAVLGVIAPFILGFGVSWLFIKELPAELAAVVPAHFSLNNVHMFIGAVLCATSVGITARVFKDLGKLQIKVAQHFGAAVIDDVLGLIILPVSDSSPPPKWESHCNRRVAALDRCGDSFRRLAGDWSLSRPQIMKQLANCDRRCHADFRAALRLHAYSTLPDWRLSAPLPPG
jgi:hypothetical protein